MSEAVYLRHLDEIRSWMGHVLGQEMPPLAEFEGSLSNGVYLCLLGEVVRPSETAWSKVYDRDQGRFKLKGLDYRHTDNINFFLAFVKTIGFPKTFCPSTLDVYEGRSPSRLVYALHALSHYLQRRGLVALAVGALPQDRTGSEWQVSGAIGSVKGGIGRQEEEAFKVVKDLVNEELQYQAMGVEDAEEETPASAEQDDIYDSIQGIEALIPSGPPSGEAASDRDVVLAHLNCSTQGLTVRVYEKGLGKTYSSSEEHLLQVMSLAVDKNEPDSIVKLLRNPLFVGLEVGSSHDDGRAYLETLKKIRGEERMPENVLCVYSGLARGDCEGLLQRMEPGSYLLRDSLTQPGKLALSFRNLAGMKHWIVHFKEGQYHWGANPPFPSLDAFVQNLSQALGNYTGLTVARGTCSELYCPEWKRIKKLSLLSSACNSLSVELVRRAVQGVNLGKKRAERSRQEEERLRQEVEERLRQEVEEEARRKQEVEEARRKQEVEEARRKQEVEEARRKQEVEAKKKQEEEMRLKQEEKAKLEEEVRRKLEEGAKKKETKHLGKKEVSLCQEEAVSREVPVSQVLLEQELKMQEVKSGREGGGVSGPNPPTRSTDEVATVAEWHQDFILNLGRLGAETVLNRYGNPGSFIVRPSEKNPCDFAIVFRTASDIRNWKVTMQEGSRKFVVKPYPQQYSSIEEVVKLFVEAVSEANGLRMLPLVLKKSVLDDMFGYKTISLSDKSSSKPGAGGGGCGAGRWSVQRVHRWMLETGLESFAASFRDQAVDGACLVALDHAQLKAELGVTALGHRHRILRCIQLLRDDPHS